MSMVSPLQPLCTADTCQASIHRLRWQDRLLQCPRCQSRNGGLWGTAHAQPGLPRSRGTAPGGQRPCNDRTGPRLDGRQRSGLHGIRATFLGGLSWASRRMATA